MRNPSLGGMLADWTYPLANLKDFIKNYRVNNKNIDLDILEKEIKFIEDNLIQYDKYQLLNLINNEHFQGKKNYTKYIDDLIRHQSTALEGSKHYSQLIMTAGYATFFGLWSQSEAYLSQFEKIWSITLLALSAFVFVFHEAVGLLINNLRSDSRNKALLKAKMEDVYEKGNNALEVADRYDNTLRLVQHRTWKYFFGIAFISGLAAILILMYSYISTLWNFYNFNTL